MDFSHRSPAWGRAVEHRARPPARGEGRVIARSFDAWREQRPCTPPSRCDPLRQPSVIARTLLRRVHVVLLFCWANTSLPAQTKGRPRKPPRKVTEDAWSVGKAIRTRLPLCEQSLA